MGVIVQRGRHRRRTIRTARPYRERGINTTGRQKLSSSDRHISIHDPALNISCRWCAASTGKSPSGAHASSKLPALFRWSHNTSHSVGQLFHAGVGQELFFLPFRYRTLEAWSLQVKHVANWLSPLPPWSVLLPSTYAPFFSTRQSKSLPESRV